MATESVVYFPKQSKLAQQTKKSPKPKATVLEWIRNGYRFVKPENRGVR